MKKLIEAKEITTQKIKGYKNSALIQDQEWCMFPPDRLEKVKIHRAMDRVLKKILPQ